VESKFVGTIILISINQFEDCLLQTITKQKDHVLILKSEKKLLDALSSQDITMMFSEFVSCLSYMPPKKIYKMPLDVKIYHEMMQQSTLHPALPKSTQVLFLYSLVCTSNHFKPVSIHLLHAVRGRNLVMLIWI